jgi:hypothetical protein
MLSRKNDLADLIAMFNQQRLSGFFYNSLCNSIVGGEWVSNNRTLKIVFSGVKRNALFNDLISFVLALLVFVLCVVEKQ